MLCQSAQAVNTSYVKHHVNTCRIYPSLGSCCTVDRNVSEGAERCLPCLCPQLQHVHQHAILWTGSTGRGTAELVSQGLHTDPTALSMQMREEKRGGLSWLCSVSASLFLHFKWINDKSPLSSQLATVVSHSQSLFICRAHSPSSPLIPILSLTRSLSWLSIDSVVSVPPNMKLLF